MSNSAVAPVRPANTRELDTPSAGFDDSVQTPVAENSALRLANASATDLLALLQDDMRNRWKSGTPASVEEYRPLLAQYDVADRLLLKLIRCEASLQLETGEKPEALYYESRFPNLRHEIRAMLEELSDLAELPKPTFFVPQQTFDVRKPAPAVGRARRALPQIPGYEILEVIGRGGMGIVYKARQIGLNRIVALKMILADSNPTDEDHQRFRQEAEAVATLRHRNIVQIFEIGEHDGNPFISLEYIEGGTLTTYCRNEPQSAAFASELVATLADAVQAAHSQNIVHRDLKPCNILLAAKEEGSSSNVKFVPKITDFGLAKKLDSGLNLTASGMAAGTPAYMAPEQVTARRGSISPATDVWALGVILYEMLTGRPPFLGENAIAIMNTVTASSPLLPRQLNPTIPVDLETICLKCLEKSPHKRYPSAAALAEDLRRFSGGRAILARRVGYLEQVWRWARRNPVVASLVLGIGVVLLTGTGIATVFALHARQSAADASREKQHAEEKEQIARENEQKALTATEVAVKARQEAERQKNEANRLKGEAIEKEAIRTRERDTRTRELYAADANIAYEAWQNGQVQNAKGFLENYIPKQGADRDLRGFEWYYIDRLSRSEIRLGHHIRPRIEFLNIAPDGERVFAATQDRVQLLEGTRRVYMSPLQGLTGKIRAMKLDPTGERIAIGFEDGNIRLWNSRTGKPLQTIPFRKTPILSVSWSPDGTILAACTGDGRNPAEFLLWDMSANRAKHTVSTQFWWPRFLEFSPDGKSMACGASSREALIFDVDSGKLVRSIRIAEQILSLGYCPWNNLLVVCDESGGIGCYDRDTGKLIRTLRGHFSAVLSLAFGQQGKLFASGGIDGIIRIWDLETAKLLRSFRGHSGTIETMQFVPGSSTLISAGHDGKCHYWKADENVEYRHLIENSFSKGGEIQHAALSPDGKKILVSYWMRGCDWIDLASGQRQPLGVTPPEYDWNTDFLLFPDGDTVAQNTRKSGLSFRSLSGKKVPLRPSIRHVPGYRIGLSADGKLLVTVADGAHLQVTFLDGSREPLLLDYSGYAGAFAISSGSKPVLAAMGEDGSLHLWNVVTGTKIRTISRLPEGGYSLCFSPDGRLLAGGGYCSRLWMWEAATGKELYSKPVHENLIESLSFNAAGDRLISASADRTVKIFDPATGRELLSIRSHQRPVLRAMFTANGDGAITLDSGTVNFWDASSSFKLERERMILASCRAESVIVKRAPRAGGELEFGYDLINGSNRELKLPVPGSPMQSMREIVLLEPLGKDPGLPIATMGAGRYVLGDSIVPIELDLPANTKIADRTATLSTQHFPPGKYRLHIQLRFADPREGLKLMHEKSIDVELK